MFTATSCILAGHLVDVTVLKLLLAFILDNLSGQNLFQGKLKPQICVSS